MNDTELDKYFYFACCKWLQDADPPESMDNSKIEIRHDNALGESFITKWDFTTAEPSRENLKIYTTGDLQYLKTKFSTTMFPVHKYNQGQIDNIECKDCIVYNTTTSKLQYYSTGDAAWKNIQFEA